MTYDQLYNLWIAQGGNPAYAAVMAAIGMAESSGNPANVNWNDPQGSFGLWQINHYWNPQYDVNQLYDPAYNAQAAQSILSSQGLNAWSTWKSYVAGSGYGYNVISKYLGPYTGAIPTSTIGGAAAAAAAGVPTSSDPNVGSATTAAAPAGSSSTIGGAPWLQAIGKIPIVGPAIEQEVSASVVGGFAIILGIIGGIWLIYSSKTAQSVIVNTGKTVAKGATTAAEAGAAIAA